MKKILVGSIALFFAAIFFPSLTFGHSHFTLCYPYPIHTKEIRYLPRGYSRVVYSGNPYFYAGGVFYRQSGRRYVVIRPPVGIVTEVLPPDYTTVVVENNQYYCHNGIYYRALPSGSEYEVVEAPAVPIQAVTAPSSAPASVDAKLVINIPSRRGGYKAITLNRTQSGGFVGPQGEYYPDCPSVEQLQLMYGY